MTKKQNMADVSILLTISNTIRTFTGLLVSVIAVRFLAKQSYGTYLQIMFFLTTIVMILSFGMPRSIYYFIPRVKNKRKFVFHSLLLLNTVGLVSLAFIILGKTEISRLLNNSDMETGIIFLSFYILLSVNRQIFNSVLLSTNNGRLLAITEIILAFLFGISMIIPLFLGLELKGVLWGILIFYAVQYLITGALSLIETEGDFSKIFHSECIVQQLKYIVPLGMMSIVAVFSSSIDRFIISYFMGIENFAIYDRGAMRIPIIGSLSVTVGGVIMLKLVEYYKKNEIFKLLDIWHASIKKVALVIFPSYIILTILAGQLITLLYTDRFEDSVIIFRIYLIILIFTITIYGNIYNAANKNKMFLYISIVITFLSAPLCIIMLKLCGNVGPAISVILMHAILFVINITCIKHILKIKYKDVFPWIFLCKLMLSSAISGIIPMIIIMEFNLPKIYMIMICLLVYFIMYYIIIDKFSLINDEDKQTVFKWTGIKWIKSRTAKSIN